MLFYRDTPPISLFTLFGILRRKARAIRTNRQIYDKITGKTETRNLTRHVSFIIEII